MNSVVGLPKGVIRNGVLFKFNVDVLYSSAIFRDKIEIL